VAKDCLVAYCGNRCSVPHVHAGRAVVVREPLDSGKNRDGILVFPYGPA
jgi:hypothetical protein